MRKRKKKKWWVWILSLVAAVAAIGFLMPGLKNGGAEDRSEKSGNEAPEVGKNRESNQTSGGLAREETAGKAEEINRYETETALPAKPPQKTAEELLEERVEKALREMTLEEKAAQLFMITPEALTGYDTVTAAGEATKNSIVRYPVGGLIYFKHNLKSPEQVRRMLKRTAEYFEEAGYPEPFLAVDEEGGSVARIGSQPAFGVERIGDMWTVGQSGDRKEAERVGNVIGSYLSELGFTLDFAPDADVLTNSGNQVIGKRSFGSDPDTVTEMALAQLQGLEDCGIYGVLKHYPGHGATSGDSHEGYAYTDKTLEELMEEELVPFAAGAEAGVPFIMAGHISVPSVTGDATPCSLSRYMLTDILRERLGYEGIIITDAMNMGAVSQQYSSAQAAVKALEAGVDIILMPADFQSAYQGVLAAVESGQLSEARIEESVRRILRVKFMNISNKGEQS